MLKVGGSGRPLGKCHESFSGGDYGMALGAASARGHEEIVKLLLDNEPDVNVTGEW